MWFKKLRKPKKVGCEYCTGRRVIASNGGGRVLTHNGAIILEIREADGSYWQRDWCWSDINYCPNCGRRLR